MFFVSVVLPLGRGTRLSEGGLGLVVDVEGGVEPVDKIILFLVHYIFILPIQFQFVLRINSKCILYIVLLKYRKLKSVSHYALMILLYPVLQTELL